MIELDHSEVKIHWCVQHWNCPPALPRRAVSRDAELRFPQTCFLASQCVCIPKLSVQQIISVTRAALTLIFPLKKVLQNNNHTVQ